MNWETFSEKVYDYSDSYILSSISKLEDIGNSYEVSEIILDLEPKTAEKLLYKAILLGVSFNGNEVLEIAEHISDEVGYKLVNENIEKVTVFDISEILSSKPYIKDLLKVKTDSQELTWRDFYALYDVLNSVEIDTFVKRQNDFGPFDEVMDVAYGLSKYEEFVEKYMKSTDYDFTKEQVLELSTLVSDDLKMKLYNDYISLFNASEIDEYFDDIKYDIKKIKTDSKVQKEVIRSGKDQIKWIDFYDLLYSIEPEILAKQVEYLSDFSNSSEIVEVAMELKEQDADKLVLKALRYPVKFSQEDILDLESSLSKSVYKQLVIKNIKLFSYEELQENYNYLESYNEFITEKFKVDKNTDLEEMFFEYDQELASEVLEIVELSLKNQKVIYEYIELVPNKSISSLYSRLKKSKKVHNDLLETLQFNQLSNRQKKKIEKKNKKGIGFFGYLFLLDLLFSKKKKNKQTENTSTWKWKYYDDLTYDEEIGTYVETDDE